MKELVATLRQAKTIAIVSHRDPDPDTIGSAIALGLALDALGKRVTLHCADLVPDPARFLTWADRFTTEPPPATADIIVTVDFGSAERAKFQNADGLWRVCRSNLLGQLPRPRLSRPLLPVLPALARGAAIPLQQQGGA